MNAEKENIYPANVSKRNSNRKKQGILLMIPMALSWSKKAISIIKKNNIWTLQWFLLSELPAFLQIKKKTWIV